MKTCIGCQYAEWTRTKAGKLHPSGQGRCTYPWTMPPLPASMYWIPLRTPIPHGGQISRKKEWEEHCFCFQRERT